MSMESLIAGLQGKSEQTGQGATPQGGQSAAKVQTRAQQDLKQAVELIEQFKERESSQEVRDNFTRRAKNLPTLVMQVGLAQAVAFTIEKSGVGKKEAERTALEKAHQEILHQMGKVLKTDDVLAAVQEVDAIEYMLLTRRLLSAWNYHSRFAVALLGEPKEANDAQ